MTEADRNKVYHDVDRLERKIDAAIEHLEHECEKLGENKSEESAHQEITRRCGGKFWGWVFTICGAAWLFDSLGWFSISVPWEPLIIILIGIALLYRRRA